MAKKQSESDAAVAPAKAKEQAQPKTARPKSKPTKKPKPGKLPPFNVILLNDDDHTYEYVIEMLHVVFGHPLETGFAMAREVDSRGRVIVLTTHKEKAELKRDQIHAYGLDPRIDGCRGSMSAIIEPAES